MRKKANQNYLPFWSCEQWAVFMTYHR